MVIQSRFGLEMVITGWDGMGWDGRRCPDRHYRHLCRVALVEVSRAFGVYGGVFGWDGWIGLGGEGYQGEEDGDMREDKDSRMGHL